MWKLFHQLFSCFRNIWRLHHLNDFTIQPLCNILLCGLFVQPPIMAECQVSLYSVKQSFRFDNIVYGTSILTNRIWNATSKGIGKLLIPRLFSKSLFYER